MENTRVELVTSCLTDIRRIGELHDYTFDDLVRSFAVNRADVQALREIYVVCHDPAKLESIYAQTTDRLQNLNFLFCNDYVIASMPVVDGQFKAVLSDVVDIQRYINRLLTLLDFIIGSSAKGLLMVPQACVPDDMNLKDFAREYVKVNGVVLIKK